MIPSMQPNLQGTFFKSNNLILNNFMYPFGTKALGIS